MEYNSSYKSAVLGSLRSAASGLNSCKSVNINIPGDFEGAGILNSALSILKSINISGIISEVTSAAVGFEAAERAVEGGMLDFSILYGSFLGSNSSSQPTRPDTTLFNSLGGFGKSTQSNGSKKSTKSTTNAKQMKKSLFKNTVDNNTGSVTKNGFFGLTGVYSMIKSGVENAGDFSAKYINDMAKEWDDSLKNISNDVEQHIDKMENESIKIEKDYKEKGISIEYILDSVDLAKEVLKLYGETAAGAIISTGNAFGMAIGLVPGVISAFASGLTGNTKGLGTKKDNHDVYHQIKKEKNKPNIDQNNEEIRRETIERSKAESERKKKDESKSDSESTEVSASSGGDNGGVDYDPVGSGYSGATIEKYNNENNRDQLLKDLSILATFKNEYDKNCKYLNDLYKDINKLSELNEKGKNKYENIQKKWNSSIEELNNFTELSNLLYDQLKTALSIQLNDKNISNEKLKQVTYKNITIDDEKTVNKNAKTKDTDLSKIVTNLDKSNQSLENMFNQLSSMQTSDPYINELKNKWNESKKRLAKKLDSLKKAVEKM